jgi:hypothetical protein
MVKTNATLEWSLVYCSMQVLYNRVRCSHIAMNLCPNAVGSKHHHDMFKSSIYRAVQSSNVRVMLEFYS